MSTGSGGSHPHERDGGPRPPAIELRHLRYFLAVSEELHFGRAAARLHIAQPPLSQAIRKLENELGVKLLNRTSRVVTPTTAGLAFAEEARNVLASFDRAIAEARRAGGGGHVIRLGCIPFLPILQLLRLLEAVGKRLPEWETEVMHMGTAEQLERLRTAELDVGIFHHAGEHDGFTLVPLFPGEPLVAYVAPSDPLAEKDVIRPEDVRDKTLVLFRRAINPALHDWLRNLFAEHGFRFGALHETGGGDSLRDQLVAVAAGAGINISPHSIKEVSQAGDVVVRRSLEPELTAPETVLAVPTRPPRQLQEAITGLRDVATDLHAERVAANA